jgi:GNAT superfamily N-acetyltransferase
MEIIKTKVTAEGIRLSINEGKKEIARTFLYLMKNDQHENPFGFLEDVYVDETKRGEGIGTAIVKAKRRNCYKLICTSRYSKPKVHELYTKLGFKDHGKEFRMDF